MSRVLVTGATGFIGRHALQPLMDAGMEVHAATSRHAAGGELGGVRWHRCDLLAPRSAAKLIGEARPTHLLHLAWCTQPGSYWTASENLDWVGASLALMRAFTEAGGRRAVVAGTCAEYAWGTRTHCVEERPGRSGAAACADGSVKAERASPASTPTVPTTLYGAAKNGLRVIAEAWARQVGAALAWGRIFNVYGPHEHPDRLVGGLTSALLRGEEAPCSHGRQVRDYLYAPELGAAFAALLTSDVKGAVNMASGEPVRIADVVTAVAAATGRPWLVRRGLRSPGSGESESLTADVRRLREEVGWSPAIDLSEGTARTVAWWRENLGVELASDHPRISSKAAA